jgi:Asp-tRNA(Asn)/Glu-tRNA(Gln) amidotransferase A subunit family amidase
MSEDLLPIGLQIMAPQWREDVALRVARAYEVASGVKASVAPVV